MEELNYGISQALQQAGFGETHVNWGTKMILIIGIAAVSYLAVKLFRHLIVPALQKISSQTKSTWDDHLFGDKIMSRTCRLIPPVIWYVMLPLVCGETPYLLNLLLKACLIYLIVSVLLLLGTFLDTLYEISNRHETLRKRPLKGIYQMINLLAICVGIILIISILIDRDATNILAGLGASAAILMLIFKDSILGLVAGIQLSANDMLRPGDWITMNKYGADGYVTEVTLTTVKIQNFDKTITTIPPYALVSDSFQNWRGMRECGGRRIKRSILIDANTVRFYTPEEAAVLREKHLIPETETGPGTEMPSAEGLVNLYALRAYIRHYLKNHPGVHPELLQMVRMLEPTSEGIPVEIYCFTGDTDWIAYEALQGAIFDHILATLPEFGLRIFQRPSGNDLRG